MTATLVRHFSRSRFEVSLILMRREGEFLRDLPGDVPLDSLNSRSSWTAWLPLARRLRRTRPDVVVSTSSGGNVVLALAHLLARSRSRLVLSERNVVYHGERSLKRRLLVVLKRLLYARADLVTCISVGLREDLIRTLNVPRERITVVYNPVVTPEIDRLSAETPDRALVGEPGPPLVVAAGRLVAQKDFGVLLRSFAEVRHARPAKLLILGEGPLRGALEDLAQSLGIFEDVLMPGFDKNPYKYMARCDAFVLSSRHEGLGNVLIEAMACGAAVISTDCPCGPSEIITKDGVDGFLVPVGDASAIANRLLRLLEDVDLRRRMGEAAKRSAQRFRVEAIIRRYEAAIMGGPLPDELRVD